ncbi:MAG: hypothetical protein GTO02_03935 [Candidatus Dadabacteria bacterium]|nr:hypothetical protein [Candidatus Dadabacteria bacterium]NIQ13576.1 hypothetical protein [Candidatus Dadabacteria bacterium]
MKKTNKYIKQLLEYRKDNKIDPFNYCLLKYASWEASLQARLQEHTDYVTPRIIELISGILEEYVDKEDVKKMAELQLELTNKYSDKLLEMDKKINNAVEEYLELYNEALTRIMENDENSESEDNDYNKLN